MNNDTGDDFASNASMKSKTIGHNKYQIKILEANSQIEELTKNLQDKNTEVEQLRCNINTSIMNLNEKDTIIQILSNKLDMTSTDLNNLMDDLHTFKLDAHNNINSYEYNNNILINERDTLKSTINNLQSTNDELTLKYQDIKKKYQITLDLLEIKVQNNNELSDKIYNLTNELNIYKDNCSKQLSDITSLKQELLDLYDTNTALKSHVTQKDDYIGQLHKKLTCQKIKLVKTDNQSNGESNEEREEKSNEEGNRENNREGITENIDNNQTDVLNTNRQIKVSSNRGIKISKR